MSRPLRSRHFSFERIEARILLSADALGGAVDGDFLADREDSNHLSPDQQVDLAYMATSLAAQYGTPASAEYAPAALDLEGLAAFMAADSLLESRHELIFVDAGIDDYETLVEDLMSNAGSTEYSVFILDGDTDGIEQISDILAGMADLDAIHLLSHGGEGRVQLGGSWLDNETLADNSDAVAGWSSALNADADILIYGCNLASNTQGLALLDSLVELTGADVAGSDDLTGTAALGGDWELEYHTGKVETQVAFTQQAQAAWVGLLDASPTGGEFLVNSTTADLQVSSDTVQQSVATDADGDFVVVWQSNLQDGSGWGI